MPADDSPISWTDPDYVSMVVGILAMGALFFYSGLVESAPSVETIGFIIFWIFIPMGLAYAIAQRWG